MSILPSRAHRKQKSGLVARLPANRFEWRPRFTPVSTIMLSLRQSFVKRESDRRAGDLHPIRLSADRTGVNRRCPLGQFTLHLAGSPIRRNVNDPEPTLTSTKWHNIPKGGTHTNDHDLHELSLAPHDLRVRDRGTPR